MKLVVVYTGQPIGAPKRRVEIQLTPTQAALLQAESGESVVTMFLEGEGSPPATDLKARIRDLEETLDDLARATSYVVDMCVIEETDGVDESWSCRLPCLQAGHLHSMLDEAEIMLGRPSLFERGNEEGDE